MSEIKCKNCIYGKFQKTEKGNIKIGVAGECTYQIEMPKLPDCYGKSWRGPADLNQYKNAIWANDVHQCPCFIQKEKDDKK